MRVRALAVALRTITESGLRCRDTPVPVAVRGVALLAGGRIVIEPCCGNLRVCVRLVEGGLVEGGLDQFPRLLDAIADPAVPGSDPLGQQAPTARIAVLPEGLPALGLPLLHFRRHPPGSDDLHPGRGRPAHRALQGRRHPHRHGSNCGSRPRRCVHCEAQPTVLFSADSTRLVPRSGARSHGRTADERSKEPDRLPAIRPLTCNFVVAGAGFEPATSGL